MAARGAAQPVAVGAGGAAVVAVAVVVVAVVGVVVRCRSPGREAGSTTKRRALFSSSCVWKRRETKALAGGRR